MEAFWANVPLGDIGAGALVTLFVLGILTGRLITKSQLERELGYRDKENEMLRAYLTTEQGISAELSKQNTALLPGANLATHIAEAIHEIADKKVS
jgi:hypothetical protein